MQCIILPLYLGFLVYCPNADMGGVIQGGVPLAANATAMALWKGSDLGLGDSSSPLDSECNAGCHCSRSDYDPVCSVADSVTHFNPCFAGCASPGSNDTYLGCGCSAGAGDEAVVVKGFCDSARCSYILFAAFVFLQVFFTFAATMPGLVASLR